MAVFVWLFIGIILAIYGCFIMSIGSGSSFYMIWFVMAAIAFIMAGILKFDLWNSMPHLLRRFIVIGMTAAGILVGVTVMIIVSGFGYDGQLSNSPDKACDYVIVLGAQVNENGPRRVLKYRLDAAIEYLDLHQETMCIVSGGQGDNEPAPEADVMKKYMIQNGIDTNRILVENRSTSTVENLQFSKALMESLEDSACIVTNNFHVYRAVKLAKHQKITDVVGLAAWSTPFYLPNNVLRECLALWKDCIVGNLR